MSVIGDLVPIGVLAAAALACESTVPNPAGLDTPFPAPQSEGCMVAAPPECASLFPGAATLPVSSVETCHSQILAGLDADVAQLEARVAALCANAPGVCP